jgi:hypothetical protein
MDEGHEAIEVVDFGADDHGLPAGVEDVRHIDFADDGGRDVDNCVEGKVPYLLLRTTATWS